MTEPRAVIFCHSTLTGRHFSDETRNQLRVLLSELDRQNVTTAAFTTDPADTNGALQSMGIPPVDFVIDSTHVGKKKGSQDWVEYLSQESGIPAQHMMYVGDDWQDQKTAMNTPILYLHANWSKTFDGKVSCLGINKPNDVLDFAEQFVFRDSRFAVSLNRNQIGLKLRSLLPVDQTLDCNNWPGTFNLKDVFTYDKEIRVGENSARDMLVLHAVSSLMLEGGVPPNPRIVVYPSSKRGKLSSHLSDYLVPFTKTLHGFYEPDLLVRMEDARDTSLARAEARRNGTDAGVSIEDQMRTVCIGPSQRGKVEGRHVIVFDDFTTSGASLEWARTLLQAAGASGVTLLTIGKYGSGHLIHQPRKGITIDPYRIETRSKDEVFFTQWIKTPYEPKAVRLLKGSFTKEKEDFEESQLPF